MTHFFAFGPKHARSFFPADAIAFKHDGARVYWIPLFGQDEPSSHKSFIDGKIESLTPDQVVEELNKCAHRERSS